MELILICAAVFLTGALVGFGVATIYTSANTIRLYDERRDLMKELADTRAQKQALEEKVNGKKPPISIVISDDSVGRDVGFENF